MDVVPRGDIISDAFNVTLKLRSNLHALLMKHENRLLDHGFRPTDDVQLSTYLKEWILMNYH